jgi:putative tricarboxylic transport membrane protein
LALLTTPGALRRAEELFVDDSSQAGAGAHGVGSRWPELLVALFLMGLALLIITDSRRVGIGWADDGPRSGYFPFYIGCLLLVSSGLVFVRQLLRWRRENAAFASRAQLSDVMAVLAPMVVYVALIPWIGIYVASTLLVGYFMRRHGDFSWWVTAAVSVGVPLVFFLVFERWFLVLLPKGPLERALGF